LTAAGFAAFFAAFFATTGSAFFVPFIFACHGISFVLRTAVRIKKMINGSLLLAEAQVIEPRCSDD